MTNEDINGAINYLKSYRKLDENLHNTSPKDSVAYFATDKCIKYWDMAIKALEQEPKTGHWIHLPHNKAKCSECDDVVLIAQMYGNANYCPNCGYRMFEPQESESKRCAELAKSFVQGLRAGLTEREGEE